MNSEVVYSFLMGMGWCFLLGWAVALVLACASVFRSEGKVRLADVSDKVRSGKLTVKASPRG